LTALCAPVSLCTHILTSPKAPTTSAETTYHCRASCQFCSNL
jgi:hypothetical protein